MGVGEEDIVEVEACNYIYLDLYQHPKDPGYVTIELFDNLEDYHVVVAKKVSYNELGVKSFEELRSKIEKDQKFLTRLIKILNKDTVSTDGEIDCFKLSETPGVYNNGRAYELDYDKEWTLVIEKYDNGFRFWIEGDPYNRSWLIEQHPKHPEQLILTFEKNGKEIVSIIRNYNYYGVDREIKDLWQLYKALVEDPSRYKFFITNVDGPIEHVKIIDKLKHPSPAIESKA
jgi:hypothetical protein